MKSYVCRSEGSAQFEELTRPIPGNKLLTAPDVVQKALRFELREGKNFVAQLFENENKGWEGVNEAYSSPPISTEQVIHPEKYFSGEEPQRTITPNLAAKLGKGWEQVSANTIGELLLRTYLEQHLDDTQAAEAAAGWGGDRYSLLTGPEAERLLIMQIKWDSLQDSAEFFDAYKTFVGVKTQGTETTSDKVGESGRKWVTPDETVFLGQIGPTILLIIGDNGDIVGRGLELLFDALAERTP
jgi:hypothetical protein